MQNNENTMAAKENETMEIKRKLWAVSEELSSRDMNSQLLKSELQNLEAQMSNDRGSFHRQCNDLEHEVENIFQKVVTEIDEAKFLSKQILTSSSWKESNEDSFQNTKLLKEDSFNDSLTNHSEKFLSQQRAKANKMLRDLTVINSSLNGIGGNITVLEQKLSHKNDQLVKLEREYQDDKEKLIREQSKMSSYRVQIDTLSDECRNSKLLQSKQEADIQDMHNDNKKLREECAKLHFLMTNMSSNIKGMSKTMEVAALSKSELNHTRVLLAEHQNDVSIVKSEKQNLISELYEMKKAFEKEKVESDEKSSTLKSKQKELDKTKDELKETKLNLKKEKKEKAAESENLNKAHEKLKKLKERLKLLEENRKNDKEQFKNSVTYLKTEVSSVYQSKESLVEDLQKAIAQRDKLMQEAKSMILTIKNLKSQVR